MVEEIFSIKNIHKSFGNNHVLKNISLEVKKGEIIGLIGSSGAGKTTLLNILVGFVRPDKGKVLFSTYKRTAKDANKHFKDLKKTYNVLDKPLLVNKSYGFAAQTPSFYNLLTVRENLEFFGNMYGIGSKSVRANIDILLKLMSLNASQHVLGKNLSGGMKRRLDIACAMVHNPDVLLLDEPTADLDPILRNQIWEIVKRINMRGTTIILSSHHLNELDVLCDRIAIVKQGKLVDVDSPERLKLKYSKMQELMIESYPGAYEKIIPQIKKQKITDVFQEGTYLTIRTEEPQKLIKEVIKEMDKHQENLIDIKLNKPNLDDVFVEIYEKKRKQEISLEHKMPKKEVPQ